MNDTRYEGKVTDSILDGAMAVHCIYRQATGVRLSFGRLSIELRPDEARIVARRLLEEADNASAPPWSDEGEYK